jgi:predicted O-linked N-acetylglucosamine transferase (SPINDLY family)
MNPSPVSLTPQQAYELGVRRLQAGNLTEAESLFRQALAQQPDHVDARFFLANLALRSGRFDEAITEYHHVLRLRPGDPETCNNLGNALVRQGHPGEAIEVLREAIRSRPDYAGAWSNLGRALEDLNHVDEAIEAYRNAIRARPHFGEAHFNLANALRSKEDVDGAMTEYREAVALRPTHAPTLSNLGNALKDAGRLDETIACYRQAWDVGADARAAGNLLYAIQMHPDYDGRQIYEEHVRWNQRYAKPLAPASPSYPNDRMPDRSLRIGYVSPDFNAHPVGRFMLPILSHHDRRRVEVFCYANVRVQDDLTGLLRRYADSWRDTNALSDAELVERIREDRIDILVDLSLHTGRNRLLVFARKPAPVQATYLSYPGTSGLETMDYRLTDPRLDPADAPQLYSERSLRLPRGYWCFQPPGDAPPVAPPPALAAGHVTFGCMNQFCKISRPAWDLWCRILQAIPHSRLLLLAPEGSSRELARQTVSMRGVDPSRLEFVSRAFLGEYLLRHRLIDIALDPFPFTGGTTTCDALWMGVPTVTLCGATAVSRGGTSILTTVGLPELVAESHDEYVEIASNLARDPARLSELRSSMRSRMLASPLMDAASFTGDLEVAYRTMWLNHLQTL